MTTPEDARERHATWPSVPPADAPAELQDPPRRRTPFSPVAANPYAPPENLPATAGGRSRPTWQVWANGHSSIPLRLFHPPVATSSERQPRLGPHGGLVVGALVLALVCSMTPFAPPLVGAAGLGLLIGRDRRWGGVMLVGALLGLLLWVLWQFLATGAR